MRVKNEHLTITHPLCHDFDSFLQGVVHLQQAERYVNTWGYQIFWRFATWFMTILITSLSDWATSRMRLMASSLHFSVGSPTQRSTFSRITSSHAVCKANVTQQGFSCLKTFTSLLPHEQTNEGGADLTVKQLNTCRTSHGGNDPAPSSFNKHTCSLSSAFLRICCSSADKQFKGLWIVCKMRQIPTQELLVRFFTTS